MSLGSWPGSLAPPPESYATPNPREERIGGFWLGLWTLYPHPVRDLYPSWHLRMCQACPCLSRSLSCEREVSQGLAEKLTPQERACSGKNKVPALQALTASLGTPRPLTTSRERHLAHGPGQTKGCPAPRSHSSDHSGTTSPHLPFWT